jgi:uncharacterized protein (TIGR02300 family)
MGAAKTGAMRHHHVTKAELGTKRTCPNCGTRYYDLNRSPIICPRCGTVFETAPSRSRQAAPKVVAPVLAEEIAPAEAAEVVSLEEADEEAADSGKVDVPADEDDEEEEPAVEGDGADVTFLEQEDEDEDVDQIIGDVDEEEP